MEVTKINSATTVLASFFFFSFCLLSSPATSQSPPAPILPPSPSPAPAPAPHHVNLTELLSVAGPFHTFLDYLLQTRVIDTFQNQANNSDQGITIFVPRDSAFAMLKSSDLANLTRDQLRTLFLYHALPRFYSLSEFRNLSRINPVATFAGGAYTLNVTDAAGVIRVSSSWSKSKISSSVYSTSPVAVYQIDRVLLPLAIFSAEPPLAPALAPAPEAGKASDATPGRGGSSASAPNSSESSSTGGANSASASFGILNCLILVVAGRLILAL
ncbi:hypothetical protein Cni_G28266 [Canna indica]|uniref:FAS1 domain-containing protein n=1 Tax=Canna indica TaxID=4628 RepID=A0AAQ3QS63_9LILI|nr:hypothetical protein Cni_G28266 [Canna indica]